MTGLAVAIGPLMVPLFTVGGQALPKRIPPGMLALAGSLLWAVGTAAILLSVGRRPQYASELLPGWLICGVGVGLALPTIHRGDGPGGPGAATANADDSEPSGSPSSVRRHAS